MTLPVRVGWLVAVHRDRVCVCTNMVKNRDSIKIHHENPDPLGICRNLIENFGISQNVQLYLWSYQFSLECKEQLASERGLAGIWTACAIPYLGLRESKWVKRDGQQTLKNVEESLAIFKWVWHALVSQYLGHMKTFTQCIYSYWFFHEKIQIKYLGKMSPLKKYACESCLHGGYQFANPDTRSWNFIPL